jgi:hypothetical protein
MQHPAPLLHLLWQFTNSIDTRYCYYAARIENPNIGYAITPASYAQVTITAYDSSHNIIDTSDEYLPLIMPGESAWIIGNFFDISIEPSSVEFVVEQIGESDFTNTSDFNYTTNPATVSDVLKNGDNIVGNVANNLTEEQSVEVVVVFRDDSGNIRGGELAFFDYLPGGTSKPFSYDTKYNDWVTENFECFAYIN